MLFSILNERVMFHLLRTQLNALDGNTHEFSMLAQDHALFHDPTCEEVMYIFDTNIDFGAS